jgi:anti-anti-sigma factor
MSPKLKIYELSGYIDVPACDRFKQEVVELINKIRPELLAIKMSEVTFMDGAGIGALVAAAVLMQVNDDRLVIFAPSKPVISLLELTDTKHLFEIIDDLSEIELMAIAS